MKFNTRYITIVILLIVAAVFSWKYFYADFHQEDTVSIHTFPMQVGQWEGEELPISEGDLAILETRNAFSRRYTAPDGKEVVLFIVYSQTNRKVSHPPEICYSGGGISILSNDPHPITAPEQGVTLKTKRLFVEQGPYQQVANYWFKVGDSYTNNYLKQQGLIAIKTFLGKPSSSAMVRVAASIEDGNAAMADATIREFILEILPLLPKYLPGKGVTS